MMAGIARIKSATMLGLALIVLSASLTHADADTVFSSSPSPSASKVDSTVRFLLAMHGRGLRSSGAGSLDTVLGQMAERDAIEVTILFNRELTGAEVVSLEAEGVEFGRIDGRLAHVGRIYQAWVPVSMLVSLSRRASVEYIDSVWKPAEVPPLDLSVPEIGADLVWAMQDRLRRTVTGKGVLIANFDTGIDVFHPDFWRADGGTFRWLDSNWNGAFDAGVDHVDLDGDGAGDPNEVLRFLYAQGVDQFGNPISIPGLFETDIDWLYNDADNSGDREFGPANGFTEADPTFGERIFLVEDANGNRALDVPERLVALGSSKIRAVLGAGGVTYERGINLINAQADTNGHGTSVSSILVGGTIGMRRFVGVAPDAELIVADRYNNGFVTYIPWARNRGADVMLYEFGGWIQHFLDGSDQNDQAVDTEATSMGIAQVVPAGNLAGGSKHARVTVPSGGSSVLGFTDPPLAGSPRMVYMSVLWRHTANNLAFTVTEPNGASVVLPTSGFGNVNLGPHFVFYSRVDSPRGTARFDISVQVMPAIGFGNWSLGIANPGAGGEIVDAYIADHQSGWSGGSTWTVSITDETTVTSPATADQAITVASYSTRGIGGVAAGDLSSFSGRGPRIDGQPVLDVAAPGNYDVFSAVSKDVAAPAVGKYGLFGGTSAAGPHVAGAIALLEQADPSLAHTDFRTLIRDTAVQDAFTGPVPNERWGRGKLDVRAAAETLARPLTRILRGCWPLRCSWPR